jgi:hypothetical protein
MLKKTGIAVAIVLLVIGSLFFAVYGLYRHHYPFGMYHRCDKQLWSALRQYAETHGGWFPSGGATPEASLSLLGQEYAYLLPCRSVPREVVEQMLARGQLLDPETCGWNYVEGLRIDSNSKLALFWDKEGLDEMGGRLSEGGHFVSFIGSAYEYVPESQWESFLVEQRKLLAEEKANTQNNEKLLGTTAPHQPGSVVWPGLAATAFFIPFLALGRWLRKNDETRTGIGCIGSTFLIVLGCTMASLLPVVFHADPHGDSMLIPYGLVGCGFVGWFICFIALIRFMAEREERLISHSEDRGAAASSLTESDTA